MDIWTQSILLLADGIDCTEVIFVLGVDGREGRYGIDVDWSFACACICDFGREALGYGAVVKFGFGEFTIGENGDVIVG